MRLAVLVPAPDYPEPWRWAFDAEAEALLADGFTVEPLPWTKAGDLSAYDLVLPLVAWGYHLRYAEWLALLDRLERESLSVANPISLLRWNSDKSYLAELDRAGVPAVPGLLVDRIDDQSLADAFEMFGGEVVVKPLVSASADGTFRLRTGETAPPEIMGRRMLIQPLMRSISEEGEYSLMLFDGEPSHSVVKRPSPGDFRVQPHLGGVTLPCAAPDGAVELARAALAAAPAKAAYARVDMIRGCDGRLKIMELELIEPALFLHLAPHAKAAFASSVRRAAERAQEQPLAQC